MPDLLPEGNTILPQDGEWRTLMKWADALYQSVGNVACAFPEGTQPLPGDGEERLKMKINKMLES